MKPGLIQGANCDGSSLQRLDVDLLACQQVDFFLVIAIVGAVIAVLIVIAIIVTLIKCWRERLRSYPNKFHQCDYLQYSPTTGSTYPAAKPYYVDKPSESQYLQHSPGSEKGPSPYFGESEVGTAYKKDHILFSPAGYESEQIYYCVEDDKTQPNVSYGQQRILQDYIQHPYASSGSATSSDQAASSSTAECSIPSSKSFNSPLVTQEEDQYLSKHKKNTLVQYKFPDVLPRGQVSQNYYV